MKNEPYGAATRGTGNAATDWNDAAEQIGIHLLEKHPEFKGLVFVEGEGPTMVGVVVVMLVTVVAGIILAVVVIVVVVVVAPLSITSI